jgi:hypothetical protein
MNTKTSTQLFISIFVAILTISLAFGTVTQAQTFYTNTSSTCGSLGTQTLGMGRITAGAAVMNLQDSLRSLGFYTGAVTGFYDINTRQGVVSFQSTYGLRPDGVVGPITRSYISSVCTTSGPAFNQYTTIPQQAYTPTTANVFDAFSGFGGFVNNPFSSFGNGAGQVTASDVYVNGGGNNGFSYGGNNYGGNNSDLDVRLDRIRSIDEDSARIEGEIHDEGRGDVRVWVEYDRSRNDVLQGDGERETLSGRFDEDDEFDENITGLRDDTRYYVRVCGEDDAGYRDCSSVEDFRTDDDGGSNNNDIDITVDAADDTTDDSADISGEVEDEGAGDVDIWVEIDEDEDDLEDGDGQRFFLGGGYDEDDDFGITISGLDDDTRYYFRACGEDEDGDEDCSPTRDFETDN